MRAAYEYGGDMTPAVSAAPIRQGAMTRFDPNCDSNMCESADGKFITYCDHAAALAASEARVAELLERLADTANGDGYALDCALDRVCVLEQSLAEALALLVEARNSVEYKRDVIKEGCPRWHGCNELLDAIDAMLLKGDKP